MFERFEHFMTAFWGALGVSVAGGAVYVFRLVFTSQRQIKALESALATREEARELRDAYQMATLEKMEREILELRADVKRLFQNNGG